MSIYYYLYFIIYLFIFYKVFIGDYNKEDFIDIDISKFIYYDENNNKIDHLHTEFDEQQMALDYIESSDIVLELGARYGTVSTLISKIVENKGKIVVVEPDKNVIPALIKNKELNNAKFEILHKIITNKNKKIIYDGYGTRAIDDKDTDNICISYNDFKKLYPYKFNVLVADCEGCLEEFIDMIDKDLDNYNKILFEEDQTDKCDYKKVIKKLEDNGFKLISVKFNDVNRYYFKRV